jgi:hypothetical protein
MRRIRFKSVLAALLLFGSAQVQAQDLEVAPGDTVFVEMLGGDSLSGVLVESSNDSVTIRDLQGVVTIIPRARIRSIRNTRDVRFRMADPNRSRLLFGPTARPIGAGNGYFALYEIFFSFLGVGIGPDFNLAGGLTLVPAAPEQVLYAAPKLSLFHSGSAAAAVGVLAMKIPGVDKSAGLVYGVTTFGQPASGVTLGLAYGYYGGDFGKNPVLMLGYEAQLSDFAKFITENYLIAGETTLLSAGLRVFGSRFSADLAMVTSLDLVDNDGLPFIPWLGIALNFGE